MKQHTATLLLAVIVLVAAVVIVFSRTSALGARTGSFQIAISDSQPGVAWRMNTETGVVSFCIAGELVYCKRETVFNIPTASDLEKRSAE